MSDLSIKCRMIKSTNSIPYVGSRYVWLFEESIKTWKRITHNIWLILYKSYLCIQTFTALHPTSLNNKSLYRITYTNYFDYVIMIKICDYKKKAVMNHCQWSTRGVRVKKLRQSLKKGEKAENRRCWPKRCFRSCFRI